MNETKKNVVEQQEEVSSQLSGVFGSTLIDISCRIVDPI